MTIRLRGTPAECAAAARQLADVFAVVSESQPYPDRRVGWCASTWKFG